MPYKNIEDEKACNRNYYRDHKKEYLKRAKKWRKNNPEKVKAIKERYLEKLLGKKKTITTKVII